MRRTALCSTLVAAACGGAFALANAEASAHARSVAAPASAEVEETRKPASTSESPADDPPENRNTADEARVGLSTPPRTLELDVMFGGTLTRTNPEEGATTFTTNLLFRPAIGYFLTECLAIRGVLRYSAQMRKGAPDVHYLAPGAGLMWLFRPGAQVRPFLGAVGGAGAWFLGGKDEPGLGYGANFDAGLMVAFHPRVAAQLGVSTRLRWFRDPDSFTVWVPFGNIGVSSFFF